MASSSARALIAKKYAKPVNKRRGKNRKRYFGGKLAGHKNIRKRRFFRGRARQLEKLLFLAGVALVLALFLKLALGLVIRGGNTSIRLGDVEAFRVPVASLLKLRELGGKYDIPFAELLAVYSVENKFFPEKNLNVGTDALEKDFVARYGQIKGKSSVSALRPFVSLLSSITNEIRRFPVEWDQDGGDGEAPYIFGDSWGAPRSDSGSRAHQGCDVLDRDNARGRLKIVSMTDGVVTNCGWNSLGGYYVGITAASGNYYYYAHLDRHAGAAEKGREVNAGDLLGFMGDSGSGKEGTKGRFQVHLHIGIAPAAKITKKEYWINPYPFLRLAEKD